MPSGPPPTASVAQSSAVTRCTAPDDSIGSTTGWITGGSPQPISRLAVSSKQRAEVETGEDLPPGMRFQFRDRLQCNTLLFQFLRVKIDSGGGTFIAGRAAIGGGRF